MEDNIQTIIVVIISIFLLFIFPVYMAYEKKDDISYALAMRYTQDLVDEVRNKGYITKYMYEDYRAKLKVTGNTYDIQMKHEYKRYDPITKYYDLSEQDKKYTLVKTTTQEEKEKWYKEIEQIGIDSGKLTGDSYKEEIGEYIADYLKTEYNIDKVEDTYELSTQVYNEDHIVNVLYNEKKLKLNANEDTVRCNDSSENGECQYAYTMNVDDTFNITIKNTNITLATVMYNMVTANVMNENTRIYVNYGGTILSSKWYGDIDYSKLEPTVSLDNFKVIYSLNEERKFTAETRPTAKINEVYEGEYKIEFDIKPGAVTELKEKGEIKDTATVDYNNFNFVLGNSKSSNNESTLSVAVGYNGILFMTNNSKKLNAKTTSAIDLGTYTVPVEKTRVVQETYTYIDETTGEYKTGVRDKIETYTVYENRQRKITDYSKAVITSESASRVKVVLTGKAGVPNSTKYITVSDADKLLSGIEKTINSPSRNVYTYSLGPESTRGTAVSYSISFTETTISISASKTVSQERVILSYPMAIKDYTNIVIEVKKNDNDKYTAKLFVDGEKMEESVEMDVVPKIDSIGSTYIGTLQKHFIGSIKNIKLYN